MSYGSLLRSPTEREKRNNPRYSTTWPKRGRGVLLLQFVAGDIGIGGGQEDAEEEKELSGK